MVGITAMNSIKLSKEHIEAVNRRRRIIFQYDICQFYVEEVNPEQVDEVKAHFLSPFDETPNQIDSVWYEWGEGNTAPYPSRILPPQHPVFGRWREAGIDPVLLFLDETKRRGKEVFLSYRINGSDNDSGPPALTPMKVEHPDWLIHTWYSFWNFAKEEVRDYKLRILEEVARMYDFDGIQLDFARVPVLFPAGEQWKNRDLLTEFMRSVRLLLLEIGRERDRPFLLAARVPENIMGCHFDGIDVERWAGERLVDILVPGCRSSDVDVEAFSRIAAGSGIKIYPSWDDHHSSDGYHGAPIEVYRGVTANWWSKGADGIHTFNLCFSAPEERAARLGLPAKERWDVQRQIYREIGSQETLEGLDRVFYVERRGGGHHESVVPNPEAWNTPGRCISTPTCLRHCLLRSPMTERQTHCYRSMWRTMSMRSPTASERLHCESCCPILPPTSYPTRVDSKRLSLPTLPMQHLTGTARRQVESRGSLRRASTTLRSGRLASRMAGWFLR